MALGASRLSEPDYTRTAATHFNYATPENEMKWDATEATRNTFTFDWGDAVVGFATEAGMKVKGHTLVWHSQLPDWVSAITDTAELRAVMINYITQVVSHYRGKVIAWDVVNEAWTESGHALRISVFSQYLGAGFIDEAFNAAHAADPDARLYYNDYGADGLGPKSDAIYNMVLGDARARCPHSRRRPANAHGAGRLATRRRCFRQHATPGDAGPRRRNQ